MNNNVGTVLTPDSSFIHARVMLQWNFIAQRNARRNCAAD